MNEELASKLLTAALALDQGFGEVDKVIASIPDESERKALARKLGDIVGAVNDSFIIPIGKQFPRLSREG